MKTLFSSITEALVDIKKGRMIIIVDDPKRENEGDFFVPAEKVTPKHILTMIRFGGGLVCAAITQDQAQRLHLPLMINPEENTEKTKVNFTYSVNAKKGITTGVSAFDRAKTIQILANQKSKQTDIVMPGHVYGLIAKQKGLLERTGHTEASVDLAQLAGFSPSGVLCEIIGKDGTMAKKEELIVLAKKLGIKMITIHDLVVYLKLHPLQKTRVSSLKQTATAMLPTKYGEFQVYVYKSMLDNREHVVLTKGAIKKEPVLTRIHSKCLTGDTLLSLKCDCGEQLSKSMQMIGERGGVLVYLDQEGRGIGLTQKILAYKLQEKGLDTVEANHKLGLPIDAREYVIAAEILEDLGIKKISLLTNNPDKIRQLGENGIMIVDCIAIETIPNKINKSYLRIKKQKLGHTLHNV